jgi:hypothetical protein
LNSKKRKMKKNDNHLVQGPATGEEVVSVLGRGRARVQVQGAVAGRELAQVQEVVAARELALAGVRGPVEAAVLVQHRYKGRDNKNDLSQEVSMKQNMPYLCKYNFQ